MSALTVALFAASLSLFLILLSAVVYLLLTQTQPGSDSDIAADGSTLGAPVFSCEVEVVVLDDHVQITNTDEQQIRLDGSGLGRGLRLVREDQLQLSLQPDINLYRMYSMMDSSAEEDGEDMQFLQVKVAPDFVEVKPVLRHIKRRLEIIIWKLKPYNVRSEGQLAERQVFCGYLQKTVHFDRSPGKYFRFVVTTSGPQNRLASFVSQSNAADASMQCQHHHQHHHQHSGRRHRLLTLRVQPDRVAAVNQSSLPLQVVVRHQSETLKRRLSREMQDLPLKGTFSFSLLRRNRGGGGGSGRVIQKPRRALRLHLTERQVTVEPHSQYGCLPLSCEVFMPDTAGDSPTQIVAGEFLSALQLPRGAHRYVMCFFVHMKGAFEEFGSSRRLSSAGYYK